MKTIKKWSCLMLAVLLLCGSILLTGCNEKDKKNLIDTNQQEQTDETPPRTNQSFISKAIGLEYQINTDKRTCTITGIGNCTDTNLIIPENIDGYQVTKIGSDAFVECANLISIVIPDSVTSIDKYAFEDCTNLTTVTIPNSVKMIGHTAFEGCISLTSITIPDSVTSIGKNAFSGCTSLANVILSNNITAISENMFNECKNLKSIILPDSVTSIDKYAFEDCTNLTNITLSSSLTNIGNSAFFGCVNLKSIAIPDSLASIGESAFYDCRNLDGVYIDNIEMWCNLKLLSMEGNPLYHAKKLYVNGSLATNLILPDNITTIGAGVFCGYTNLFSITIPNSVTEIGNYTFDGCTNLAAVYYTGTVQNWEKIEFGIKNETLNNATIYYYSSIQPTESGNYWRYVDGVPTAWE